ncbi:MAG: NUDIX hydrolase [Akkermansia sp.]
MSKPLDARRPLWEALEQYCLRPDAQLSRAREVQRFIESSPRCFDRHYEPGHITGSCLLLNPAGDKCLLTLHRKLKRWLQLGGHAEGETNVLDVAQREAVEESGITEIEAIEAAIFDVDIHLIPERPHLGEPAHFHYDIRYLMRAAHEDYTCSEESDALAWLSWQDAQERWDDFDEPMRRLYQLWRKRPDLCLR